MAGYPPGPPYASPSAPPYTAAPQSYINTSHQPYTNSQHQPYGAPPQQPYAGAPQKPYGAPPQQPYGGAPQKPYAYGEPSPSAPYPTPGKVQPYGGAPEKPYAYSEPTPSAPYPTPGKVKPYGGAPEKPYGVGSPFAALLPSAFPPGTDPNVVACFRIADQDGSGVVDDKELQRALSTYNQSFSIRTVQLLMFLFSSSNARRIGPKEFIPLFYCLQSWRVIFERFDRDRSGKIDKSELREALMSLGYAVSPSILDLLLSKFDKSGGQSGAIEYDNFIECCLTVKGLTEKFKEKDTMYTGSATFTYESFMLTVLQFLIA